MKEHSACYWRLIANFTLQNWTEVQMTHLGFWCSTVQLKKIKTFKLHKLETKHNLTWRKLKMLQNAALSWFHPSALKHISHLKRCINTFFGPSSPEHSWGSIKSNLLLRHCEFYGCMFRCHRGRIPEFLLWAETHAGDRKTTWPVSECWRYI